MRRPSAVAVLLLLSPLAAMAAPASADLPAEAPTPAADNDAPAGFTALERQLILDWYDRHPVPAGLLPKADGAGAAAPGKPIPRKAERRPLPSDLAAKLPRRAGLQRWIVGRDVLLLNVSTGLVADILHNVLGR